MSQVSSWTADDAIAALVRQGIYRDPKLWSDYTGSQAGNAYEQLRHEGRRPDFGANYDWQYLDRSMSNLGYWRPRANAPPNVAPTEVIPYYDSDMNRDGIQDPLYHRVRRHKKRTGRHSSLYRL